MSPAPPRRNASKIPRRSDLTDPSEMRNPLKDWPGTPEIGTGADTRTGRSRRQKDGSVHVARHLSPLRLKAGADQCSEADGPTSQVASEDESTRLFLEPWFLVRLPPGPQSQNGGQRRTEDRGERAA
ncbi:hypothetical protein F2Q69_00006026 [Brassica cretica]|uniref:Uncharacterized protein n=1 Tax=Brassica cretica TaxID=69181 RepID=A0A8S9NT98_BRACR|nr:hypothetical protein F2Q69_00006026 [Brassica cretica]